MCAGCFTQIDAVAWSAAGATAAASVGWRHLRSGRAVARQKSYEETASFLELLGHDPDDIIGPPPVARLSARA